MTDNIDDSLRENGYEWTPLPSGKQTGNLTFNIEMEQDTNPNGFWKYEEDKTLKDIEHTVLITPPKSLKLKHWI